MPGEALMWKWWRKAVIHQIGAGDLHVNRIESMCTPGYPDVEGCYKGAQFFLELKSANRPVRSSTCIHFGVRADQFIWHNKRAKAGGQSWFLCGVGKGKERKLYLIPGTEIPMFSDVPEPQLVKWLVDSPAAVLDAIYVAAFSSAP